MKKNWLKLLVMVAIGLMVTGCSSPSTKADTLKDSSEATSDSTKKDGTITFYIARHGKTMLNTTDRVQGWSDAVLTPAGIEVAEYLGTGLQDTDFVAAYSSDSGRSMQTAHHVLEKSGQSDLELKTDERLREFNFGTYEGDLNHTMWTDLATKEGKTLEEWKATMTPESFANGVAELDKGRDPENLNWPAEDYHTITTRLKAGMDDIVKAVEKEGGGNVLIVSHGLSISALVDVLDPEFDNDNAPLKNASITKITYQDGKYTVETVGDMSYVEAGQAANKK